MKLTHPLLVPLWRQRPLLLVARGFAPIFGRKKVSMHFHRLKYPGCPNDK